MQAYLAHMRNIEQARVFASVLMFLHDALRVLHRHFVAGEGHHAGTQFQMQGVQWRAQQFFVGHG
ncbi:hypothetical protein D9M69_549190 [compost metagenome]